MKISFADNDMLKRITLQYSKSHSDWLLFILKDYLDDHDIDDTLLNTCDVMSCFKIFKLIEWMKDQDFTVSYWENKESQLASQWDWGIEIPDNCPRLMEYRLKVL